MVSGGREHIRGVVVVGTEKLHPQVVAPGMATVGTLLRPDREPFVGRRQPVEDASDGSRNSEPDESAGPPLTQPRVNRDATNRLVEVLGRQDRADEDTAESTDNQGPDPYSALP